MKKYIVPTSAVISASMGQIICASGEKTPEKNPSNPIINAAPLRHIGFLRKIGSL